MMSSSFARRHTTEEPAAIAPELEHFLGYLSARLTYVPLHRMDMDIVDVLELCIEVLGVDRCTVLEATHGASNVRVAWAAAAPGVTRCTDVNPQELVPSLVARILRGQILAYASLDQLPLDTRRDADALASSGCKSLLVIPLRVGSTYLGALALTTVHGTRSWPDSLIDSLCLLADMIANALARKHAEEALQNSRAHLDEMQRMANLGSFTCDPVTWLVIGSAQLYRIFHIDTRADLDVQEMVLRLHPNDRDDFVAQLSGSRGLETEQDHYRLIRPGEGVRLLVCRTEVVLDATSAPRRIVGLVQDVTELAPAHPDPQPAQRLAVIPA